ncbi:hypothetical protein XIS1_1300034 [Xenorhabdus innexi]|uniref:Uncharacterized protein n=1 Tax=Xenorhabdus innexi TaxID=290109 RepID=A0A1N6MT99_9GAMM|nr:hypothetical protein [Xenorhabdus innexi]SIP71979.1 hypothetical protein XIS1_1300034 [Xenorhabdus innexi]
MPFSGLFKTEFEVGDLIFGLADVRARYVDKNPFFSKAKSHFNKGGYPPIYIDQYLTLAEIFRGITTDIYIKKELIEMNLLKVNIPMQLGDLTRN